MRPSDVRRAVWRWAEEVDRPLPWRGERDPWRVLCSEVMLQQTQASRVAEVYPGFMERFPTAEAMATSGPGDVLRAWSNLGYNRRAVNLWRAAAIVASDGWSADVDGLATLPGVGAYTARAVASFAFGTGVAAVDANVRRVVTRVFGDGDDVQGRADELVPRGRAGEWNQAMIDFGALVCRARSPRCERCPLAAGCVWHASPTEAPARRAAVRFEDTTRYARGRVVGALRDDDRPLTMDGLRRATGLEEGRLRRAIAALVDDGTVHRAGRAIALGPAGASRR